MADKNEYDTSSTIDAKNQEGRTGVTEKKSWWSWFGFTAPGATGSGPKNQRGRNEWGGNPKCECWGVGTRGGNDLWPQDRVCKNQSH